MCKILIIKNKILYLVLFLPDLGFRAKNCFAFYFMPFMENIF